MQPSDAVFVTGLEFEANHGYTAAERRATRRFRVDIELDCSLHRAAQSDRLGDTIDYRSVCEAILRVGTSSTYRLLEALAGGIVTAIQEIYPQVGVRVELHKLAPPCPGVPASCGVRLCVPPRE
ncbi:dihydroneopterin aldolase [Haliangium ochraceum]|uniref:7,8-dihydroneopterin aldolase n=1 Tax=Haliangium ochraceum (strain DSM 14365 / JCM 11303 / SMP-2) TaxID=502025 RepID=D0LH17_HALO1|nr:dihydroneopterin aldolase [Haliangium ochraceum]ACY14739.1 dihydroneopterin aldolase [Haliangium ochraceum DSM 14365]